MGFSHGEEPGARADGEIPQQCALGKADCPRSPLPNQISGERATRLNDLSHNDQRLWRICLVSVTVAAWLFILAMLGIVIGGLVLWGDLSAAIGNLAAATDNLAQASETLASTVESISQGPNLIRSLIDLTAALIDVFE